MSDRSEKRLRSAVEETKWPTVHRWVIALTYAISATQLRDSSFKWCDRCRLQEHTFSVTPHENKWVNRMSTPTCLQIDDTSQFFKFSMACAH